MAASGQLARPPPAPGAAAAGRSLGARPARPPSLGASPAPSLVQGRSLWRPPRLPRLISSRIVLCCVAIPAVGAAGALRNQTEFLYRICRGAGRPRSDSASAAGLPDTGASLRAPTALVNTTGHGWLEGVQETSCSAALFYWCVRFSAIASCICWAAKRSAISVYQGFVML